MTKNNEEKRDGLTATRHVERSQAFDQLRADADRARNADVARLQQLIAKANADFDATIAKAEAKMAAAYTARAKALVREFYDAIGPLVVSWYAQPTRELSESIGELVAGFNSRAVAELRAPTGAAAFALSLDLLACAFAAPLLSKHPAAVNAFASQDWGAGPSFRSSLHQIPAVARVGGPALYSTLEEVENALRTVAVRSSGEVSPEAVRRYQTKHDSATAYDLGVALAELEREIEAKRRRGFARDYVPPGAGVM